MCSSIFGPASAPSLVTWPIRKTLTPLLLASCISRSVHSRSWLTLPGRRLDVGAVDALDRVDDHHASALAFSMVSRIVPRSVSLANSRSLALAGRAAAPAARSGPATPRRRRTGPARCACATSSQTWASSVLLPTPGSPPIRTSEPRHDPAAEHPPELVDADRQPVEVGDVDLGEAERPSAARDARATAMRRRAAGLAAVAASPVRRVLRGYSRPRTPGSGRSSGRLRRRTLDRRTRSAPSP